jgi:L-ascorbate 6-phosphate lactonase
MTTVARLPDPASIVASIEQTQLADGMVAFWWLGQSGFLLRSAGMTIYLDPFLSEHPARLVPPLFPLETAPPADIVFCTHEHWDHLDPATLPALAQHSPRARFVVPRPIVDQITALGIEAERVVGVQPDEEHALGALTVFPMPARHGLKSPPAAYDFGSGEQGSQGHYRYLGYVIELAGVRVYHAGDTVAYDGLVERLQRLAVDVALLPINGRSYFREQQDIVGNFDEREAAEVAAAAGVKVLVPIHHEIFAANLGRPGALAEEIFNRRMEVTCYLPAHGRRFTYVKGDGA